MRFLIAAVFVYVFAISVHGAIQQYGQRSPDDELLHLEIVTRKFKIINGRISEDYVFPAEGWAEPLKITYIRVTDMWDNESSANLTSGGPGEKTATFHLEAKLFKGFSFLIEFYGYKNKS